MGMRGKEVCQELSSAPWLGDSSLQGKTILLYPDQGFGDTLQFCRYVKLVAALGAKVILQVQPPLVGLLRQLEGASEVIAMAIRFRKLMFTARWQACRWRSTRRSTAFRQRLPT